MKNTKNRAEARRESPILFSGPMVRALFDGSKTMTRRVGKYQKDDAAELGVDYIGHAIKGEVALATYRAFPGAGTARWGLCECPYGVTGDRLYVKEQCWMYCETVPNGKTKTGRRKFRYVQLNNFPVYYCLDHPNKPSGLSNSRLGWRKKVGRFMPRSASRLKLEITGIKVERLNDISEADCLSEGVVTGPILLWKGAVPSDNRIAPRETFKRLWESIHGEGSWAKNPWVWAITFVKL